MTGNSTWFSRVFNTRSSDMRRSKEPGDTPTPVTIQRVGDLLVRRGYHFRVDSDGDLTGVWDMHRFWFILLGDENEVLQIRGRWGRKASSESRLAILRALNDVNRDRIFPKVFLRDEDDELAIYAETSVILPSGATDRQLSEAVMVGLGTGVQFFRAIDGQIPPGEDEEE